MVDKPAQEQRRAHFRLPYPGGERPVMHSQNIQHEVVEIAEGGVRLIIEPGIPLQVGDALTGDIVFHDGEFEAIGGKVLRQEGGQVVVQLSQGITLHRVMLEQSYLRQKYPDFLQNKLRTKRP